MHTRQSDTEIMTKILNLPNRKQFRPGMCWNLVTGLLMIGHICMIGLSSSSFASSSAEITPGEIVKNADLIRFPAESFQVDVKITTIKPEGDPEVREYKVLSKGNDRTLLMTVAPAIDKGNIPPG